MQYVLFNKETDKIIQEYHTKPGVLEWSSGLMTSNPRPGMSHEGEIFAREALVNIQPTPFHEEVGYTGKYVAANTTYVKTISYTFNDRMLDQAKITAKGLITEWKKKKQAGGFVFANTIFQSDASSRMAIQEATMRALASNTYTVDWTASDNTAMTMDAPTVIEFGIASSDAFQAVHQEATDFKSAIDAATTLDEIQEVLKSAGV